MSDGMNLFGYDPWSDMLDKMKTTKNVRQLKENLQNLGDDYENLRQQYNELVEKYNALREAYTEMTEDRNNIATLFNRNSRLLSEKTFLSEKLGWYVERIARPEESLMRFAQAQILLMRESLVKKLAPEFVNQDWAQIPLSLKREINIKLLAYAAAGYENLVKPIIYFGQAELDLEGIIKPAGRSRSEVIDKDGEAWVTVPLKELSNIHKDLSLANSLQIKEWPCINNHTFRDLKVVLSEIEPLVRSAIDEGILLRKEGGAQIYSWDYLVFLEKGYEGMKLVHMECIISALSLKYGYVMDYFLV